LTAAENISKEGIVVEAPDPVASCRFKSVCVLQFPTKMQISDENTQYDISFFLHDWLQKAYKRKA
jgi:hypothetical protein